MLWYFRESFEDGQLMVPAIKGLAIEVTPRRSIHLLVGYVDFVLVKSLLCFQVYTETY